MSRELLQLYHAEWPKRGSDVDAFETALKKFQDRKALRNSSRIRGWSLNGERRVARLPLI